MNWKLAITWNDIESNIVNMSYLRLTEPITTYTAEQQKETVINLHQ